jgi:hypothetical protein
MDELAVFLAFLLANVQCTLEHIPAVWKTCVVENVKCCISDYNVRSRNAIPSENY